jgi:pimeloyl-ACP methyl ester carboxylesterase
MGSGRIRINYIYCVMKPILIAVVLSLMISGAYAQNNPTKDPFAIRFIKFYNAGALDSLHTMFAAEFTKVVPVDKQDLLVRQLKMMGGNLVKVIQMGEEGGEKEYIFSFVKPAYLLNIALDKAGKIQGVFPLPNTNKLPGDVTIKTPTSVIKGTLSVPDGLKTMPVVLIIAGSGPTDRDGNSTLSEEQTNEYLMLGDSLKQKGIAVLRYDKRGVGQSSTTKKQGQNTLTDYVDDARAIIEFLKADKRFSKVIIAGHSEGSLIGMIACDKEKADAFISIAGMGFLPDVVLKKQLKVQTSKSDYKKAVLIIDSIKAGQTVKQETNTAFGGIFNPSLQPYWYSVMQYNAASEIAKLKIPVLILQGTHDFQVSVGDAKLLKKAKPDALLKLIAGMSHILKDAPADRLQNEATYHKSDLPLNKELVPTLVDFINSIK